IVFWKHKPCSEKTFKIPVKYRKLGILFILSKQHVNEALCQKPISWQGYGVGKRSPGDSDVRDKEGNVKFATMPPLWLNHSLLFSAILLELMNSACVLGGYNYIAAL
ncbi:hypothetical protein ACJX0J_038789, partial [Zea mays]